MTDPLVAAGEVGRFLTQYDIPYVVLGGLAVQVWGDARLTVDADISIADPLTGTQQLVELIVTQFKSRSADPFKMARRTRMILVSASNGVDVDISLALPGYEDELFERAAEVEAAPGVSIRLCSAEDLVILKAVAGRPLDVADIEGVVARQGKSLDASYIRRWLNEFANVLARPEISERFDSAWNR